MLQALQKTKDARRCAPKVIAEQIGMMTILAISGTSKRLHAIKNREGDDCGLFMFCGRNRAVEIILDFSDTYSVRRYRIITSGAQKNELVLERHEQDIYCDNLADVAYSVSCWQ